MEKTFNLHHFLQKQANLSYDGDRGYFLAQTRAWMNCIKCNQNKNKSAQEAWQACFDEFQKSDGKLSWIQNHVGVEAASKINKKSVVDYQDKIKEGIDKGKCINSAVSDALNTLNIESE